MGSRIIDFKKVETREKSIVKNNNAEVVGVLVGIPQKNHENRGIQYYIAHLKTKFESKTASEKSNILPILLTENDIKEMDFIVGAAYLARGRWSSIKHEDGTFGEFLFAKKVVKLDSDDIRDRNHVELDGYVRRRPLIKECYNGYKEMMENQAETLVTIPRPAGKTPEGKDKIKTDTVTVAFRGTFVKAALALKHGDRISVKGYIEECKDEDGNLIKYVAVPTDVTVMIESIFEEVEATQNEEVEATQNEEVNE